MRSKEYSHDYRYFPDPDLVPIIVTQDYIEKISRELPELPEIKRQRFRTEFNLPEYDANVLTETPELAAYFEAVVALVKDKKTASNWVMGPFLRALKEHNDSIATIALTPNYLAEILQLLEKGTINANTAKTVFDECLKTGQEPKIIVQEKGLVQITDTSEIETVIDKIIIENDKDVQDYINGNSKVLGYLMGQVMRATKGKANPQTVNALLRSKLETCKI